jgi:hypothetical protein
MTVWISAAPAFHFDFEFDIFKQTANAIVFNFIVRDVAQQAPEAVTFFIADRTSFRTLLESCGNSIVEVACLCDLAVFRSQTLADFTALGAHLARTILVFVGFRLAAEADGLVVFPDAVGAVRRALLASGNL